MEIIKLGDICKIVNGKDLHANISLNEILTKEKTEMIYVKTSCFENGYQVKPKFFVKRKYINNTNVPKLIVNKGDLVISKACNIGEASFIKYNNVAIYRALTQLIPNEHFVIKKYLFYWLNKNKKLLESNSKGTTIKIISLDDLHNMRVKNLPKIEDQQQIIDIIEPFEKIRENISIKIQRIFDIADKFYEIKEKQKIKISLLASLDIGKTPSRKNKNYWENGEIHWINSGAITNNNVVLTSHEKITKQAMIENNLNKTNDNDILISIIEPSKNKISISCSGITYNQSVCRFRPNEYNFCFFISLKNNLDFISSLKHGSAQQSVNKSQLLEHDIFYVKDTFFENIFKYVKHLEKIKFLLDKIIKNLIEIHIK